MRRAFLTLAVLGALGAAGCRSNCGPCRTPCAGGGGVVLSPAPQAAPVPAPQPAPATAAALPYNPTCPVRLGNPVDPNITTVYEGKVVGFCSTTCREKFLKNPAKYAKNLP